MPESKGMRAYNITVAALMAICLGLSGWAMKTVVDLSVSVKSIEERQFSKENGLEVWKEIGSIRKEVAFLANSGPPAWFIDRVSRIEDHLTRIDEKLDKHVVATIKTP